MRKQREEEQRRAKEWKRRVKTQRALDAFIHDAQTELVTQEEDRVGFRCGAPRCYWRRLEQTPSDVKTGVSGERTRHAHWGKHFGHAFDAVWAHIGAQTWSTWAGAGQHPASELHRDKDRRSDAFSSKSQRWRVLSSPGEGAAPP